MNVTVPYYNLHQEQPYTSLGKVTRQTSGIGDITFMLIYTITNNPYLSIGAGIKTPTGWYKTQGEPIINGQQSTYPMGMQLGTGTWDPAFGLFYNQQIGRFSIFGNILFRYTGGANEFGDRIGNEAITNFGTNYMFMDELGLIFMLNLFNTGQDTGPNTREGNTGVTYLYASPGIIYAPIQNLSFQLMTELPIYRYVNGIQVTPKYNISFITSFSY